ncbi:hypothetical protein ANN_00519 [Periplaneta americana]|uniref:Uncharacterized protein n=1 Tax=Periplaneta americana TaxID=6978 RepID=A0ABQ8TR09_PERAM|nr:hypothetical protein ANN_00519 [Periplaneta americana]
MEGLCEGGNEPPGSLKANSVTPGKFTMTGVNAADETRTLKANIQCTPEQQQGRQYWKAVKKSKIDLKRQKEGLTYVAGRPQVVSRLPADPELRSGVGSIPAWADYLIRFSPTISLMSGEARLALIVNATSLNLCVVYRSYQSAAEQRLKPVYSFECPALKLLRLARQNHRYRGQNTKRISLYRNSDDIM